MPATSWAPKALGRLKTVFDTDDPTNEISAAWGVKELLRHAQTSSNIRGLLDTQQPGASLTRPGREQAVELAKTLLGHGIDALYVSTLVRTQQTATPLAAVLGLEFCVREGLREVNAGDLETLGDDASKAAYLNTIFAWSSGQVEARLSGGENGVEAYARFDAVVAEIAGSGATTAVAVSHGGMIRSWAAARVHNVSIDFATRNPLINTGVVVLCGDLRSGWHAVSWQGEELSALTSPHRSAVTVRP